MNFYGRHDYGGQMAERLTRGQAIRAKCLDCCCGSIVEVRRCAAESCPLWRYRTGGETEQKIHNTKTQEEK